ncbi:MAG: 3-hydroxybutyrate dehydrogenase [Alphaproteobacteria bacterium]|jgi:3-hydroxybutyrate dehydrogenase
MGEMLTGRTALITGSTSGIGAAYAHALANEGADIMLNGFGDAAVVDALRAEIADAFGVTVLYNAADMTKPDEVRDMVGDATERLGKVDILINNAGMQHRAPVLSFPEEKWNDLFAVNVTAPFIATKAVLPQMIERDWGRVINTASANALITSPGTSAYTATKHAILGFTKSVALEMIETGVTCNAICPGTVRTNLSEHRIEEFAAAKGVSKEAALEDYIDQKLPYHQPMRRFITVEEIAAAAVYLCSDAGAAMRGSAFTIDGGWTAR